MAGMLGEEQLEPHIAIGDHPAVAVMGVTYRLLDAFGDGLVAQFGFQHLLFVVGQEVILHVGLDRLVERLVFADLEEPGDGGRDGLLEHHIGPLPLEIPIGIGRDRLLAILEGEREAAVEVFMRRLLDAGALVVEHEDGVIDEFVGIGLARHNFMQRAVDVFDHEVDRVGRQAFVAEEECRARSYRHAPARCGRDGGNSCDRRWSRATAPHRREHEPTAMPIGRSSMPERARADHFLPPAAQRQPPAPALGRRRVIVTRASSGRGGKGPAMGFGHVVQHLFEPSEQCHRLLAPPGTSYRGNPARM